MKHRICITIDDETLDMITALVNTQEVETDVSKVIRHSIKKWYNELRQKADK